MQSFRISHTVHHAGRWLLSMAAVIVIQACAADGDSPEVSTAGDELKGGIPANGKEKTNMGKHGGQAGSVAVSGQAGSVAVSDQDAGPGKGQGKSKSVKKDKTDQEKGSNNKPVKAAKPPKTDGGTDLDEDETADEGA